jgi:hypothetical protein
MNINGAFPSTYLKAADLAGRRVQVVMSHVTTEEVGDGHKPILHFQGKDKGLVLNKTNANMIIEITGTDETDHWAGHAVTLYVTKVDYQGKRVDAIRVDYPQRQQQAPPPPPPVSQPLTDEDIPF